ncbi:hypothetical protein COO60DRAFT_1626180 [Scenedesmus sp. NREL 46B-D3]|nr:hypothetical protein COO60DRAFT_1626180 [Scenedesmus sp. NREL 46B-D3]
MTLETAADMASAAEDAEAQGLRVELDGLRQRLSSCKTVHDLFLLTEKAAYIAKTAAAACRKRAADKEPTPAAAGAGEGAEGAAVAAADAAVPAGQLPDDDDGVSCLLLRLPRGWGPPRLQAFIERFGAKPTSVSKTAGECSGLVKFETAEHRSLFYTEFVKAEEGGSSTGSLGKFLVKFPGGTSGAAEKYGVKRPAGAAAAGRDNQDNAGGARKRQAKEPKSDIREVVCPWWNRPYADQLQDKMAVVNGALRALADKVAGSYGSGEKPAWLSAAHLPVKQVLLPPGIMRSPQLDGYRNKAEFTIGLDAQERPTAGFLMGNYVDGVTQVADPAECRHISPTALAYAAAMTSFLRSADNQLPVWDKRYGSHWPSVAVSRASFDPWDLSAHTQPQVVLVSEQEPAAPLPSDAIVMVQVDPTAAPGGEAQIEQQLRALATALKATAADKGLPMTALLAQYHAGVANAAPPGTPLAYFPGEAPQEQQQGGGAGQVGAFSDAVCEVKFRVSPNAFFQVNNGATCLLYNTVGRMAGVGPKTLLLDVCCGTGTIGITLAKQVAAVIGVDNVESAIADARVNAELNGVTNATFVCDMAETAMETLLKEHAPKHEHVVAVVDPPRAGLHQSVLRALLACAALKRLVFVSCNPDTLVLNVGLLCGKYRPDGGAGGRGGKGARGGRGRHGRQVHALPPMAPYIPFQPTQVACFDLFPHTKHVEVVMLLERQ